MSSGKMFIKQCAHHQASLHKNVKRNVIYYQTRPLPYKYHYAVWHYLNKAPRMLHINAELQRKFKISYFRY
jgi:hypothetical protein